MFQTGCPHGSNTLVVWFNYKVNGLRAKTETCLNPENNGQGYVRFPEIQGVESPHQMNFLTVYLDMPVLLSIPPDNPGNSMIRLIVNLAPIGKTTLAESF
jgi:hypothetical protein